MSHSDTAGTKNLDTLSTASRRLTLFSTLLVGSFALSVATTACYKAEQGADKSSSETADKAAPKSAAAVVADVKKPTKSATAVVAEKATTAVKPAPADGLKKFTSADHKFSVMVASTAPQKTPMSHAEEGVKVEALSYNFKLSIKDALAMVASMTAQSKGKYDIEVGLDGAVSQGIAQVKGTISKSGKEPYKGRPARQFEFSANWQGATLKGVGRAVGIEDRRILMVFSVWPAGKTAAETACRAFVKSFEAEL